MPTTTGTHDLSTLQTVRFQSAAEFGLDTIAEVLQRDLAAHNQSISEMMSELVEFTTDRQRIYGASVSGDMVEVDEYGRSATQRQFPGSTVGFPLRMNQFAIGWTQKWFELKTPADVAVSAAAAKRAHLRALRLAVQRALFQSANYNFVDFLEDQVTLGVKRLVNADGQAIPDGPNAETFDGSTHTHYLARAGGSLAASDVNGAITTVVEHGHGGMVKIAINKADEAAYRALTGFVAYVDPRVVYRNTDTPGQTLDITRQDNRAIGLFGAAEVWVKPWIPANYALVWDSSDNPPLAFRQRSQERLRGLRIAATNSAFPLYAQYMEAEFGVGVWNRTNASVLYWGNTTYADPTL